MEETRCGRGDMIGVLLPPLRTGPTEHSRVDLHQTIDLLQVEEIDAFADTAVDQRIALEHVVAHGVDQGIAPLVETGIEPAEILLDVTQTALDGGQVEKVAGPGPGARTSVSACR